MKLAYVLVLVAACGEVSAIRPDARSIDASDTDDGAVDAATDTATNSVTCVPAPAGLFARWRAEMDTSDAQGGYIGTTQGGTAYAAGRHGFSFVFDGINDTIAINDGDVMWPNAGFSVEAWVKSTASGSVITKYQCGNACPTNSAFAYWGLSLTGTGTMAFALRTDAMIDGSFATIYSSQTVDDGQWHHAVGVRDATTLRLYVDGTLAASQTLSAEALGPMTNMDGSADPTIIGAGIIGGQSTYQDFFAGALDEVAYYTVALPASHIAAVHAAPGGTCP